MMYQMRTFSLCLLIIGSMNQAGLAQRAVILVRHAEKEPGSGDVALSEVGKKRAEELARALKDAGVEAIYTTAWRRTKQTAEPLASLLNTKSKAHDTNETPASFAKRLERDHANQTVLVVGHSNTIPELIDAIAKRKVGINIGDGEFNQLFILLPKQDGRWNIVRTRY